MARKKIRAALKPESRKLGMDPAMTQAFRELEESRTREYLEEKRRYRDAEENLIAQLQRVKFREPDFLKDAREGMKLSQRDLATVSGISSSSIGNFEAGLKVMTVDTGYKIYRALFTFGSVAAAEALDEIMSIFLTNLLTARERERLRREGSDERIKIIDFNAREFGAEQKKYLDRITDAREKKLAAMRDGSEKA